MDCFDDYQIEDFSMFDFVDEMNECLFEENEDEKSFANYLNSEYDY